LYDAHFTVNGYANSQNKIVLQKSPCNLPMFAMQEMPTVTLSYSWHNFQGNTRREHVGQSTLSARNNRQYLKKTSST
jgi:hypothetical protein